MRTFVKKIFFLIFINFLCAIIIIFSIFKFTPPLSKFDYDGGLKIKNQLLKNTIGRKVVLIGGSNCAMGISAQTINDTLNNYYPHLYSTINYGHRFQFGLTYYLNEIQNFIKPCDVVVFSLEYQILLKDYFSDNCLNTIFFENLNNNALTSHQFKNLIKNSPLYLYARLHHRKRNTFDDIIDHNRNDGFNRFGDLVIHHKMKKKIFGLYESPNQIEFSSEDIYRLQEFITYCKKNNILLLNIPPAFAKSSFNENAKLINEVTILMSNLNIPYLRNPEESCYSDSLFFDSPYHMQETGTTANSNRISRIIASKLNQTHQGSN